MTGRKVLYWLRKGLRLHDNPTLLRAAELAGRGDGGFMLPVFVLDPVFTKAPSKNERREAGSGVATTASARPGPVPFQFLFDALEDLDGGLRERGSRLYVARGAPLAELKRLAKEHGADTLAFEVDTEPYARKRDAEVREWAKGQDIEVVSLPGHTLYDLDAIAEQLPSGSDGIDGKALPPTTYSAFRSLVSKAGLGVPDEPQDAPDTLPSLPPGLSGGKKSGEFPGLPTLEETHPETKGKRPGGMRLRGGEAEALRILGDFCEDAERVAAFEKPKTSPTDVDPADTTMLSAYMTHGCLSARKFYHAVEEAASAAHGVSRSSPPVSLHGQLLWREFYYFASSRTPNFERMEGNPISRQIPWGDAENDEKYRERLAAWKEARTGFPWIDAAMTQLREEGWIHHLARHAVACFLTRGDLWCSWEDGRDHFSHLLVDGDMSLNSGNWMWLSCSAFFHQYFRIYSPVSFAKKYDKSGAYVRKYLPQLKKFPDKYIYEPHQAPASVQRSAGCIIGKDYPEPIVDHSEASNDCKNRMHEAFDANREAKRKKREQDDGNDDDDDGNDDDDDDSGSGGKKSAKRARRK